MRPVLDAMEGPKKTICDIYSDIIHGVIESKDDDVMCYSTEELLAAIEEYNDKIEKTAEVPQQKRIIVLMDAKALFTSLKAEKSSEIVREETINSSVKFDNVNMEELGIYLRQNLPAEYIMKNNLDELLPKRVSKKDKDVLKENEEDIDRYEFIEDIQKLFEESYNDESYDSEIETNDNNLATQSSEENLHYINIEAVENPAK